MIPLDRFPEVEKQDYAKLRSSVKSGDILLCSGVAVFSKLIQKATESVWSHVGFILRLDEIDRVMVLESVESIGVRTVPLSHYVRDYGGDGKGYHGRILIARHKGFSSMEESKLHEMSKFAVDLFGYPYDQDEIIRIAARIASTKLGFKKDEFKQDREYICSEYAWECYKSVGLEVPHDPRGFVAPKDFAAASEAVCEVLVEH